MNDLSSINDRYGANSRVISIRLNTSDEIERRALEYLASQEAQGFKPREIIARALAAQGESNDKSTTMLREILSMVQRIESGAIRVTDTPADSTEPRSDELSDDLKSSLLNMLKPVRRAGE